MDFSMDLEKSSALGTTMALQQVEIHQKIQLMLSQNCD
jgi:hypothetical protein